MFGDWLYGHFEAYALEPDRIRPDTPQGRCLGAKQRRRLARPESRLALSLAARGGSGLTDMRLDVLPRHSRAT